MLKKVLFFVFCFFLINVLHSQDIQSKVINGKVLSNNQDLDGVNIVNLKTDDVTTTDGRGYFLISASVGDTLMFSSIQFKPSKMILTKNDFVNEILFVKLEVLYRQIAEVKVFNYKNINAVSLGILSKPAKEYTPAERRLYTATGSKLVGNTDGTTGISMGIDGIFNALSGRTTMLKKDVLVERKEFSLKKIADYFDEMFFIETLKIPVDYVKGFQYYIVDDVDFIKNLNNKDKTMARFLMGELAVKYLNLLKEE